MGEVRLREGPRPQDPPNSASHRYRVIVIFFHPQSSSNCFHPLNEGNWQELKLSISFKNLIQFWIIGAAFNLLRRQAFFSAVLGMMRSKLWVLGSKAFEFVTIALNNNFPLLGRFSENIENWLRNRPEPNAWGFFRLPLLSSTCRAAFKMKKFAF